MKSGFGSDKLPGIGGGNSEWPDMAPAECGEGGV